MNKKKLDKSKSLLKSSNSSEFTSKCQNKKKCLKKLLSSNQDYNVRFDSYLTLPRKWENIIILESFQSVLSVSRLSVPTQSLQHVNLINEVINHLPYQLLYFWSRTFRRDKVYLFFYLPEEFILAHQTLTTLSSTSLQETCALVGSRGSKATS